MKRIATVVFDKAIQIGLSIFQQRFSIGWDIVELAPGRLHLRGVPDDTPCGCVEPGAICDKHAVEFEYQSGIGYVLTFRPEEKPTKKDKPAPVAKPAPAEDDFA